MTRKERIINRIMAMASVRGDITRRGTILTDYDEAALAVLADAAAATEARRAGMKLTLGPDGDWLLTDDLDGEPFTDDIMAMFEDNVADRLNYLIGVGERPSDSVMSRVANPLPRIRQHRY